MGRKRTGTFRREAGGVLRLRIPVTTERDGREVTSRLWAEADPNLSDEAAAALAAQMTEHFAGRVVDPADVYAALRGARVQTVAAFVRRVYLPSRLEHDSYKRQVQWWDLHILPTIGTVDVRLLGPDHLRLLVEQLDRKVADPSTKFGWKTAVNVWGLVTRFCADLASHKDRRIRIRQANPALGVRGPDRGDRAVKQWLYPTELAKLLACPLIPVSRRRRWACLVYMFARAGELAALDFDRIDLEHGLVTIDRAVDLRTGKLGLTKTHDVRVFPLEPLLAPLLDAMAAEGSQFGGSYRGAQELRDDLRAAGVTREELFVARPPAAPITQHDLRATGITYLAMRGETDDAIRERAGHADFKTTLLYIRRGRRLAAARLGDPFAELPEALLAGPGARVRRGISSKVSSRFFQRSAPEPKKAPGLCEEEDLNLLPGRVAPEDLSGKAPSPELPHGSKVAKSSQSEDAIDDIGDDIEFPRGCATLGRWGVRRQVLVENVGASREAGRPVSALLLAAIAAELGLERRAS